MAVELIELWRVIRKHLAMIVVVTVVAVATAGILSKFVLPKQYASTATLMVIPQNGAQDLLANLVTGQSLVDTYAQVADSRSVLQAVAGQPQVGLSATALSHVVTATPVANTDLLTITVTATNPLWASRVSNAVAQATVATVTRITRQRQLEVVDPAVPVTLPVAPKTKTNVAIALVLGLLVGGGLAFLLEYLDDSLKSEEDVKRVLDLPVLTVIPLIEGPSFPSVPERGGRRRETRPNPPRRGSSGGRRSG
jgi:capsular polysaccharide biosynthesis protein